MPETRSLHTDLAPLLRSSGPFVSLYLDTHAAKENAPHEIELRWRSLRDKVAGAGAPEGALTALDELVDGAHQRGWGLAAIAAGDELAFERFLRHEIDDEAVFGPLPHLLPLIAWHQTNPDHAVVIADREGATVHLAHAYKRDEVIEIEGGDEPVSLHAKGGWRAQRFQRRIEVAWETNAQVVADELRTLVARHKPEIIVLTGDVRAVDLLRDRLDQQLADKAVVLEDTPDPYSLDEIDERVDHLVSVRASDGTDALVKRFVEERGQSDLAVEGIEPVLGALRASQVDTLLIARPGPQGSAWFVRSRVDQASTDEETLRGLGLEDLDRAHVEDVLVCAAVGTGARVRLVPDLVAPHEGVGALLRYATPSSP